MAESDTRSVQFTAADTVAVGRPDEYLTRPGFWHGAIGVGACWLGGARAVAAPLYERALDDRVDAHTLAHLGAVDAALAAGEAMLLWAAAEIDADPENRKGSAELVARRTRAVVEIAVDEAISRTAPCARPGATVSRRPAREARGRSDDLRPSEPRRTGPRAAGPAGGSSPMTAAADPTGNCARFAARPLTVGGTPAPVWLDALADARELDLTDCDEIVVVAAHPDDETLGFGATAVTLAGLGVRVQVVSASDGGASHPGLSALQRYRMEQHSSCGTAPGHRGFGCPAADIPRPARRRSERP